MKNILEEIYQHKLIEVRNRKKNISLQEICAKIKCSKREKDPFFFFSKLKEKNDRNEVGLICEIKKASPSHGILREDFDHLQIAKDYTDGGATCLSILTDEKYFMGSDRYLSEVRAISDLPILRKEFLVDTYQVYETKSLGADCILLIVSMLDDQKLQELEKCALDLGLSVLIEVHDEKELQRAAKLESKLLGINNRNLKTLETNLETSLFLSEQVPSDYLLVSESGIKGALDVELLQQAGINCFLIGEHFMTQKNITESVKKLLKLSCADL